MIYFDFDGTLADVWQRYYRVFVDASRITGVGFEDYIRIKREFPKDAEVARRFGGSLPEDYWQRKRSMLEDPAYLKYDRLLVSAERICTFFKEHDCRIITNRRHAADFRGQVAALGLEALLDRCIVLNPDEKKSKTQYLREVHPEERFILVGDAEAEAQAAAIDLAEVFLVKTGLRIPESLPGAEKCRMIESVDVFMNTFKETD